MQNQELQYEALKIIEERSQITQRQLSVALGVSLGKANYVVKALIELGWIKLNNFRRSDNKLGYAYFLTPLGLMEKAKITRQFLTRKQKEYKQLEQEIHQLKIEVEKF
jgi:EPS-associated MarR family transcriptional regulator